MSDIIYRRDRSLMLQQIEQWFDAFRDLGYLAGFLLLYLRAMVPILPLFLYITVVIHAYGFTVGIITSWLGIVAGTFTVYLICKRFIHSKFMLKIQQRTAVKRLIHFIDRQGLVPIFILLCFPFTPTTLVNFVASLSHIKTKYYFIILLISKLISILLLGMMGTGITTLFTHPIRGILLILVTVVLWIVGKQVEKYFMGQSKEK